MNIHRRRIVAFIASNLVASDPLNKERASMVYDIQAGHETVLSGEVSPALIAVYDHDRKDYVLGHRKPSQLVSLTDLASQHGIDLELNEGQFHGVDYETGKGFKGAIANRTVTFFDEADQTTYEYRV
jgi:hypothetical protein